MRQDANSTNGLALTMNTANAWRCNCSKGLIKAPVSVAQAIIFGRERMIPDQALHHLVILFSSQGRSGQARTDSQPVF